MAQDPDHRRVMQASGSARFVGFAADADAAETASTARQSDVDGDAGTRAGQFAVELDGAAVPGVRRIALPGRYSAPGTDQQGGERWGQTTYDDLELERGLAPEASELFDWRAAVEEGRAEDGRKELAVVLRESSDGPQIRWTFSNAWPKRYEPPQLDATADGEGEVATEWVTVAFDAVERVVESGSARRGPERSAVSRFVATANDGRLGDGAAVVAAGDVGVEAVTPAGVEPAPTVDGEHVGLLVPAGVRAAGSGGGNALWLLSGADADGDGTWRITGDAAEAGAYWISGDEFFHATAWVPGGSSGADSGAATPTAPPVPGWPDGRRQDVRVLVVTGGSAVEDVFGVTPTAAGAAGGAAGDSGVTVQPATAGEAVSPGSTVVAAVERAMPPYDGDALETDGTGLGTPDALFDAGRPAPLAGATFGLATLSTPDASVLGQSVNPLVGMETAELLRHDAALAVLERAGVTDADTVEWLAGPREAGQEFDGETSTLLNIESPLRSFEGVVSGRDGPWLVGVHVARVTAGDHVVAAGVHRHPVGSAGGLDGTAGWEDVLARGRALTAETAARLEFL